MYELVELSSGNLVGAYPDQDIALLVVMETLRNGGDRAVATLALGLDDQTGQTDGQVIAQGKALADLARARYATAAASAPTYA
jgi:hypothetical protein